MHYEEVKQHKSGGICCGATVCLWFEMIKMNTFSLKMFLVKVA